MDDQIARTSIDRFLQQLFPPNDPDPDLSEWPYVDEDGSVSAVVVGDRFEIDPDGKFGIVMVVTALCEKGIRCSLENSFIPHEDMEQLVLAA